VSSNNPLIIERPHLQRPLDRALWASVTWAFWLLWFYLWLPIITVIGWYFGIATSIDQMVERLGYLEFLRLLPAYALVVTLGGALLIGWSYLQYRRFHGRDRRRATPAADAAELASQLGLPAADLATWQHARRLTAFHTGSGQLLDVRPMTPAPAQRDAALAHTASAAPAAD